MVPKIIPSGVKQDLSDQSLQKAYHCINFKPPRLQVAMLGSTQELFYS